MRTDLTDSLEFHLDTLARLVAIPGVSADGIATDVLEASAAACADVLRDAGFPEVDVLRTEGAGPAVWAQRPGPAGAPTVLLYCHHDVQPAGDLARWTSPPFTLTRRDGRLYGRGSADDKAGLVVHLAALRAAFGDGDWPLTVRVLAEGDEEIGSPQVARLLAEHADALAADVVIMPDAVNADVDVPALTVGLRGMVDLHVQVDTLAGPVHSGLFGGAVPDALGVLLRLLASLTGPDGRVLVPGLITDPLQDGMFRPDPAAFRADTTALAGVEVLDDPDALVTATALAPSVTVVGIDAPSIATSSSSLSATAAARVLVRIAPGQDAEAAGRALTEHLAAQPARGARVDVRVVGGSPGAALALGSPVGQAALRCLHAAYGKPAVAMAVGGSIPFAAAYRRQFGDVALLITAVQDPQTRAHGYDESLSVQGLVSAMHAEALLLRELADGLPA